MADLATIRNALASTIQANVALPASLGGGQLTALGYLPAQVNPPMAIVAPQPGQSIVFDTFDGGVTYHFRVILIASYGEDISAQGLLDGWLSTNQAGSVINAINSNLRLGNSVDWAVPTTVHSYGVRSWGDQQYFGAEILVSVATHVP